MGEVRVCPGALSARGRGACARPGAGRVARSLTPSSRRRLGARPTPCHARSPFGLCVHAGGCAFRARPAACCGFSGDTAGCEAPLLRALPCPYAFPLGPQLPPRPRGLGAVCAESERASASSPAGAGLARGQDSAQAVPGPSSPGFLSAPLRLGCALRSLRMGLGLSRRQQASDRAPAGRPQRRRRQPQGAGRGPGQRALVALHL